MMMMDSEQRRKRKRGLRPHSRLQFFLRTAVLCLSFFIFLLFLSSDRFPLKTSYRPVLKISPLSLLPLRSSYAIIESSFTKNSLPITVEERVLFPDHVLLFTYETIFERDNLECVYHRNLTNPVDAEDVVDEEVLLVQPVLSVDEYDSYRSIARCPLPPRNYSSVVHLKRAGHQIGGYWRSNFNQVVPSWQSVVYAAVMDGDTAVVFVKGLNLRSDRASDHTQFTCRFGLSNLHRNDKFALTTKAVTAAQEIVRCQLPLSVRMNPRKASGISVTVDRFYTSRGRPVHFTVPSVAKIYGSDYLLRSNMKVKHELCACTMLWNQATSLREWIMYHSWLGVERWFIYDNNSDDGTDKVIEELNSENFNVTRQTWPWIKTQEAGFSHCVLRAKDECNWVGYFDVDEFFYFPNSTTQNSLRDVVANFTSSTTVGEIRTACHSFGPSNLTLPPTEGMTVGYTCRMKMPERHKSIIRPDALDNTLLNVVHHFRLKPGFESINLHRSIAVINHYKYQVWESFKAKFRRRVATYVADWQENQNEGSRDRAPGLGTEAIEPPNWSQRFCEVWDTGLRDFVLATFADPTTGSVPWDRSLL